MAFSPGTKESASLADFMQLLRLRKALIALILGLVLITTLAVTAFLPNWYLATTKIRVEKPESEVKLFQAQVSSYYDPYFLQDQFKILQSEKILYPVIENLGLNAKLGTLLGSATPLTSQQSFIYMLRRMLKVESQRSSSLIEINVYAQDPALAASIANEIARVYSDDRIYLATSEQREGLSQLKQGLSEQEATVSRQRDVVEKLRKDLNISGVDLNARVSDMEIETLRQMQNSLIAISVDTIGRKTRYEHFKAIPLADRLTLVNSELIQDTNIQNLLQAYLIADQNVTKLRASGLGEAHRDLISAIESRNKMREQLDSMLHGYEITLENSYKEAEARVTELKNQLGQAKVDQILSARDRMRPFEEAAQKLDDDQRMLTNLKLALRQKEIDFQVPKRTIEILNTAEPARFPSKPDWTLNTVFALLFGSILGVGVAVLLEYFDMSFRNVADVESRLKLPVLGVIPFQRDATRDDDDPADTEPYRVLHTNLNLALTPGKAASFVIFSAGPGEGKSTTLHHLARVMAVAGERVLLIDSDVRRPTQHRLADRPRDPGLSDLLLGKKSLDEVIQPAIAPNLDFLPSGATPGFTISLLYVNRLRELIAELRGRYDRLIFDSPPIIGVSDASVLASAVDGAVLLIQHRRNPASMVIRAQQIIESLKTPLLGVVLNQVPTGGGDDYGYYTSNYSYYGEDSGKKGRRSSAASKGKKSAAPAAGDADDRLEFKE